MTALGGKDQVYWNQSFISEMWERMEKCPGRLIFLTEVEALKREAGIFPSGGVEGLARSHSPTGRKCG